MFRNMQLVFLVVLKGALLQSDGERGGYLRVLLFLENEECGRYERLKKRFWIQMRSASHSKISRHRSRKHSTMWVTPRNSEYEW